MASRATSSRVGRSVGVAEGLTSPIRRRRSPAYHSPGPRSEAACWASSASSARSIVERGFEYPADLSAAIGADAIRGVSPGYGRLMDLDAAGRLAAEVDPSSRSKAGRVPRATGGRLFRHDFRGAGPPGAVGLQARIAVGLDFPSADDDPCLVLADHQAVRGRRRLACHGDRCRDRRRSGKLHPGHDVDDGRPRAMGSRRTPSPVPVTGNPVVLPLQYGQAETEKDRRAMAVMVGAVMAVTVARVTAMALVGKRRGRQADHQYRREGICAADPDERSPAPVSALFVPHPASLSLWQPHTHHAADETFPSRFPVSSCTIFRLPASSRVKPAR